MRERRRRKKGSARRGCSPLLTILAVIVVAAGFYYGYQVYAGVRGIITSAELPFIGQRSNNAAQTGGTPGANTATDRQLTDRANILLLGIDRRDNDPGPWRTDTMMVVSIDPASKSASMLSIPRDLWVSIPGMAKEDRINTAHVWGDQYKTPGGGPALAKKTVQYNLGIPIHYYVRVDFRGFEKIIDTIGGIDVDVPKDIVDYQYPTADYGVETLIIRAGRQHMNGTLALKYARTRHADSDIGRARRQQQVLLAVRDKVLSLNFPLTRVPELLRTLGDSIQTDMNLEQIIAAAQTLRQVQSKDIRQGVIDETMVTPWVTAGGAEVLLPQQDKIRVLVSQLFPTQATAASASLGSLGDTDRLAQEAARIEVQNGAQTAGLATRTTTDLRAAGYNVVRFGNADRFDYADTVIIYFADKKYTLASLKARLQVPDAKVTRQDPIPGSDVDIRIILGASAAHS